jgi:hypothetical protein
LCALGVDDLLHRYADPLGQLFAGRPTVKPGYELALDGVDGRLVILDPPRGRTVQVLSRK